LDLVSDNRDLVCVHGKETSRDRKLDLRASHIGDANLTCIQHGQNRRVTGKDADLAVCGWSAHDPRSTGPDCAVLCDDLYGELCHVFSWCSRECGLDPDRI